MLAFMNQFTGMNGIMYYASQILSDAGIKNVTLSILSSMIHSLFLFKYLLLVSGIW